MAVVVSPAPCSLTTKLKAAFKMGAYSGQIRACVEKREVRQQRCWIELVGRKYGTAKRSRLVERVREVRAYVSLHVVQVMSTMKETCRKALLQRGRCRIAEAMLRFSESFFCLSHRSAECVTHLPSRTPCGYSHSADFYRWLPCL